MKSDNINRRSFCRRVAVLGGAFGLSIPGGGVRDVRLAPSLFDVDRHSKARVVIAKSDSVRDAHNKLVGGNVEKLVNTAIENLVETHPASKAWAKLFDSDDVVGIKINCLAGRGMSTRPEIVDSIIEGLLSAGVRGNKIIVWDRLNDDLESAGYRVRTRGSGVRYYGNDHCGYDNDLRMWGEIGSLVSRVVTQECTALINVPVLKDHGIVGVSLGLKNYFGAIHNPNKYHHNVGDPYVADVNMIPEIRQKTRLTLGDGLSAQYEGGPPFMPQWSWNFNGVLAGFDMVALDTVGWGIIEDKRREKGLGSLKEVGREPAYIATAADRKHSLGVNDSSRIERIEA